MVSPYLSRPLRSLREVLGSGQAPPQRRPGSVKARPTGLRPSGGLLGATEALAGPEAENPLAPPLAPPLASPLAPRQPFTAVAGTVVASGAPESSPGNGSGRDGA